MADKHNDFTDLVLEGQRMFALAADDARLTLVEICAFGTNESARISAAKEILDRAYGKSASRVELTGRDGGPVEHADVTESANRFSDRMRRLAEAARVQAEESEDE